MSCNTVIVKLPFEFEADRIHAELARIEPYRWLPGGAAGDLTLPLVSPGGLDTVHRAPPVWATDNLERCPYLRQVLAYFRCGVGDARARKLRAGAHPACERPGDWAEFNRYRLHLPIAGDGDTRFRFEARHHTLAPGEVWIYDPVASHGLVDPVRTFELFVTIDTVGSGRLDDLVLEAERAPPELPELIPYEPGATVELVAETTPGPAVLNPGDVDCFLADLLARTWQRMLPPPALVDELSRTVGRFRRDWRALWSVFGEHPEGWPRYHTLALRLLEEVSELEERRAGAPGAIPADLPRRLRGFFLTGALNFRAARVDASQCPTPQTQYELAAQALVRLDGRGNFDFWNPVSRSYVPAAADDLNLVRQFARPARAGSAAAAAGMDCDPDLLRRLRWYALQHLIRPLDPLRAPVTDAAGTPLLDGAALTRGEPEGRRALPEGATTAPAGPDTRRTLGQLRGPDAEQLRLRLRHAIYFRLTTSPRLVDGWIPALQDFRLVDWRWIWLAAALARGESVAEAARWAGVRSEGQLVAAVSALLELRVLERAHPRLLAA